MDKLEKRDNKVKIEKLNLKNKRTYKKKSNLIDRKFRLVNKRINFIYQGLC
jgi:hypothetical protein